jgi:hypothetical protein
MSTTTNSVATTTQTPQQGAIGNLSNEWILLITPGLTTSIPANSSAEITFTISGLLLYDFIEVNKLNHIAGLSVGNARVSAANTLAVQMVNSTASAIALQVSDQYLVSVERPLAQQVTNGLTATIPNT